MNVRSMRPDELNAAVSVWRETNIARGAPHGPALQYEGFIDEATPPV